MAMKLRRMSIIHTRRRGKGASGGRVIALLLTRDCQVRPREMLRVLKEASATTRVTQAGESIRTAEFLDFSNMPMLWGRVAWGLVRLHSSE